MGHCRITIPVLFVPDEREQTSVLSQSQELDAVQGLAWKPTGKIYGGKLKYLNFTWMSYALGGVWQILMLQVTT